MSSLPSVNLNSLYASFGSTASGIDVSTAVSQILYADRAVERQWQVQQALVSQQTTALTQLQSGVSSLQTALQSLNDPLGALFAASVSSTQPSIVSATAAAGATAGSHIVVVQNLATTAAWYSDPVASSSTPFAPGSFDLTVGSGASQTTTTIALGSGVNTPDDLVNYINGLNLGISANTITDANGTRVALVSNSPGGAADFSLASSVGSASPNLFSRAATGANATLTVDGVPISSATNSVSGVINGLTLDLNGQSPTTQAILTVGTDVTSSTQAVNDFVTAYNSLIGQLNAQFAYNSSSQTAGPLSGDTTVRLLQTALLAAPSYAAGSGTYATLRSLGITMNDDGTLSVNSSALAAALRNNPSAVQSFFQAASSSGFAGTLNTALNSFSDATSGAFTVDLKSLRDSNTSLQNQINDYEDYLTGVQSRLTAQYNQANILLLQLPTLEKQISAMLGNSTSSNG